MYFPEATGPNNGKPPESDYYTSEWVRSYGNYRGGTTCGWGTAVRTHKWGKREYGNWHIGAWGVILAKNLLEKHGMPICMVNGPVGDTRIDQHQRNAANPNDEKTIYGKEYGAYFLHIKRKLEKLTIMKKFFKIFLVTQVDRICLEIVLFQASTKEFLFVGKRTRAKFQNGTLFDGMTRIL